MINLKILQTFKTAVDAGSFSSAAKILNYSPSTVSKHIAELEHEIGASLIIDNSLPKVLTPIGEITYNYAVEATAKFKRFKLKVDTALEKETVIRIGGIERYLSEIVISKVISYQQQDELVQFDLISRTSDETLDLLKDFDLDIGLVADRFVPPSFEGVIVKRESLVLIASKTTFTRLTKENLNFEKLPILIDKKVKFIFNHVLKDNNRYQKVIHVEGDDMVVQGVKDNFCLGVTSDGNFSSEEFYILKVYSEESPVRLIYSSKIHEDKSKEQFLQSLIRHVKSLNLL